MIHSRKGWIVLALLAVASLGDIATTVYGIEYAGLHEQNPGAMLVLEQAGYTGMIAVKIGVLAFAGYATVLCKQRYGSQLGAITYLPAVAVVALNLAVTANNTLLILAA